MKKNVLIITFLIVGLSCLAQDKDLIQAPKSKLEAFSEKAGAMFKKEYFKIAQLHDLTFEVLTITNLSTNESMQGLLISSKSMVGTTEVTWRAFLDQDEIDGFLKAVTYMSATVMKNDFPTNYTEYTFQSRSGFSASIFNITRSYDDKQKWKSSFKLIGKDANLIVNVPVDDFGKIKDAIAFAHTKLSD